MLRLHAPLPPPRGLLLPVELKAALAHVLSYGPLPLFCSLFPCYPSPFLSTVSLPSFYVTPCCGDFKLILKICRNKILHPFCTQHEIFTTLPRTCSAILYSELLAFAFHYTQYGHSCLGILVITIMQNDSNTLHCIRSL